MEGTRRMWSPIMRSLIALLALGLAACGPAARSSMGSGPVDSNTSNPLPSSLRTYPTETPTITPVPAAPDCVASQLAATFWEGLVGAGNMFGTILLRNTSASACSMEGAQTFYGVDAQGRRDTPGMSQPYTLARVVLPSRTPAPSETAGPTPGAYLEISIIGGYRDDGTDGGINGLCTAANEVVPATFVVTLGSVTLRVANYSPVAGWAGFHSIEGCHGAIGGGDAFLSQ